MRETKVGNEGQSLYLMLNQQRQAIMENAVRQTEQLDRQIDYLRKEFAKARGLDPRVTAFDARQDGLYLVEMGDEEE